MKRTTMYVDCGGKVCDNGGKLNEDTCECECKKPWHVGDLCEGKFPTSHNQSLIVTRYTIARFKGSWILPCL